MRLREFFSGSLRRQLIFGVAAVHAVMMTLFVWDLTIRQQDMLLDHQSEQAQTLAQTMATSAAGWLAARDIAGLQELAEAQRRYPQLVFAMLLDPDGKVLAHTDRTRQGQYVQNIPQVAKLTLLVHGSALVDAIAPAMLADHTVGWARVGIGQQEASKKLAAITRNGILYALAAMAIGSILALFMANRLTRKLYVMRRVSDTVRAGHQEARVPDLGDDEAGQLARDFNAMLNALSSSEKRFTNIVNLAADAIISVNEEQRILIFNQSAERIFGYTSAEMLGQPLDRLLPAHLAGAHRAHVRSFAAEPETARDVNRRAEIHGRRKDGTEFPAEANISKVKENGNIQFTVFLRDISARKQAEEEIRQLNVNLERRVLERTIELHAANQELEAFSYSVSHDLRAPLRSIDGFSQAVLEDYADKLDDQGKDYLGRVRGATQRMGHLIDDMLALSRVTRAEMRRETVDLSALAADVFAELQKGEPLRRVDWHIESGLAAEGDARLLRVALVNMLGNAWKFTSKTANAKIEFGAASAPDTGNAPIPDTPGTPETQGAPDFAPSFFVRDNGAGYDMSYADKLFGAFQRLHLLSDFPGTGIGLATVQRIIHRHGGRVWAEGAVGKGATFYFNL